MVKCYETIQRDALVGYTYVNGVTAAIRTYADSPRLGACVALQVNLKAIDCSVAGRS